MISFTVDGVRFNLRAAAVIIDEGHVLLHRASDDDFWAPPGGRVEAGEASAEAVVRELIEEMGPAVDANVGRLVWVIESFYRRGGTRFH